MEYSKTSPALSPQQQPENAGGSAMPRAEIEETGQRTGLSSFKNGPVGTAHQLSADNDAPLVDLALASVRQQTDGGPSASPSEELAALQAEVNRLSERVTEIGSASARLLRARSADLLKDARTHISSRPLRAVLWPGLAGFLFGTIR